MSGFLFSLSPAALDELNALIDARADARIASRDREPTKRWMTPTEAGTCSGISQRATYMRIRSGRIPKGAVKHVGRSLLIDRQALDRALEGT